MEVAKRLRAQPRERVREQKDEHRNERDLTPGVCRGVGARDMEVART